MPSIAHVRTLSRHGRLKEAIRILLNTYSPPANNLTISNGKLFHSFITDWGFTISNCTLFQNRLINMYVKCERLLDARKVFDRMTQRDAMSWNVMIAAYRRHGFPQEALTLFYQMQKTGVEPDEFIFASILPACAKMGALKQGMDIHEKIIRSGFLSDVVIGNALIDMYAKCGKTHVARKLFDKFPKRDVVSWNAMIAGYAQNGVLVEALRLFKEIPQADVVSWNAIIAGYLQNGFAEKALEMFKQMELAQVQPDQGTFASILPACARVGALEQGMDIHHTITRSGFSRNILIGNALIDMYAKCGSLQKARELFDKMPQQDVASWNAMIAGYAHNSNVEEASRLFEEMPERNLVSWNAIIAGYAINGFGEKALNIYKQMQQSGVQPDQCTFCSILPACAKMGSLEQGMCIHQHIIESGLLLDVVASALLDMYAKCGSMQKARELFDSISLRDVVSWTSMISGYAMHGYGKDALKLFELMKYSRANPDHVCFVCVLFACSHIGLVDEGCKHFITMSDFYCIVPTIDHYVCMVDLLGRAGYLEEAFNFIIKMPIKPDVILWVCLLGCCRSLQNIQLGEYTATFLSELDPINDSLYVLLSDIYADEGRWSDVQKVRRLMKDRGIKKIPGCSWIEVHKMIHAF